MRHKDLLSRLTGRGLKDVCLHNRISSGSLDRAGWPRHADAGSAGAKVQADSPHCTLFATTKQCKPGLKIA
jgi:hypothetical protein